MDAGDREVLPPVLDRGDDELRAYCLLQRERFTPELREAVRRNEVVFADLEPL
ncbi:hypothetical protein ACH4SK_43270 [Streptomyces inhibens]|uniref:hypothetical protein n=1 Tax=Streptomyces inhibens TaxID=2293571 RepID=UPI003788598F